MAKYRFKPKRRQCSVGEYSLAPVRTGQYWVSGKVSEWSQGDLWGVIGEVSRRDGHGWWWTLFVRDAKGDVVNGDDVRRISEGYFPSRTKAIEALLTA